MINKADRQPFERRRPPGNGLVGVTQPICCQSWQLSETSGGATQTLTSDWMKTGSMHDLIPEAFERIQVQIRKTTKQRLTLATLPADDAAFVRRDKEASRRAVSFLSFFVVTFQNEQLDAKIKHKHGYSRTRRVCFSLPFFYTRHN